MNGFQKSSTATQNKGYSNGQQNQHTGKKPKHESITGLWIPRDENYTGNLIASGICKEDGYTYKVFKNDKYVEGSSLPQYNLCRIKTPPRNQ